jgi:hypothetical protein
MHEKEKKLRDIRVIEANRKKLTGMRGKLWLVARHLGGAMISHSHGGTYCDTRYLEDPLAEKSDPFEYTTDQERIPYMDDGYTLDEPTGEGWRNERRGVREPVNTDEIGWHFDGLSRGMHLEIKCTTETREIVVYDKGYLVYKETGGELEAYAPSPDWEGKIDKLFEQAKAKDDNLRAKSKKQAEAESVEERQGLLERLKHQWGLK